MNYYVDTSALAKRYIPEVGTNWIQGITAKSSGNVIVVCALTPVEIFSLLARRQREGSISATNVSALQRLFSAHYVGEYISISLESVVLNRARDLVTRYTLRALDAVQLASAVEFSQLFGEPLIFITADNNLVAAAAGEGFSTDNPLFHP